jgi:leader peptidase (prepilin peptidase)/N-methyltransferase
VSFEPVVVALVGLAIGSFLNVCIHRIPRKESIVHPSSKCPKCGAGIKAYDNIPVLSYMVLGGKCRSCKTPISPRYPLVEALNAALYVLVYLRFGAGWHLPAYFAFVSALIVITFIDLDTQTIPDRITLGGLPVGLLAGSLLLPDPFMRAVPLGWQGSVAGAALGFGMFFLIAELSIRILKKEGMGGGDIKMMAMAGSVLGWKGVLLTTFAGSLSGALAGIGLVLFRGGGKETRVPFGPFLALGALTTLLAGQEILRWYLHG